jgi:hypothetical protein
VIEFLQIDPRGFALWSVTMLIVFGALWLASLSS